MNLKINPKFVPLYLLLIIVSVPVAFLGMLEYYFALGDINRLIDFGLMIVDSIGKRPFKSEIYVCFGAAAIAPLLLIYFAIDKKGKTTHGKAKWAKKSDIESTKFSLTNFIKGVLGLINPLNFTPKKYAKALKEFFKFGFYISTPMLDVNFHKGGFLLGNYREMPNAPDWVEKWFDKPKPTYYNAPLATLIVAPPGAGKSAAVAIPNLLSLPTSCVVLDIKGELCDLTAGYRQQTFKNEVYIFNPLGKDNNLKFNPFDKRIVSKLDFNGKRRLVDEIANTIFVKGKNEDEHWITQGKNLFTFFALYDLCTKNESSFFEIANAPIQDFIARIPPTSPYYKKVWNIDEKTGEKTKIDGINPEKIFYEQCGDQKYADIDNPLNWKEESFDDIQANKEKGIGILDEIVRNYARAWARMADGEEFSSVKSTFNRVMTIFTSYQVRDATDSMSFEYEDLRKKNITLYIKIAQTDIDTLKSLIRVLLESIAKNLMTRESKDPKERIYLILDEFIRFGEMPFLLEMPALCRSYNIVPLYITQSFGLIKKYYGEDDLKTIIDTVAFQVLFKMNDAESAEQVSKQIGQYTRENVNYSTQQGQIIFGGTSSHSLEGKELISAQDIMNIPNDEVIILVSGHKAKPIKLKAALYFKNKDMLKRLSWAFDPTNKLLLKEQNLQKTKPQPNETAQNTQTMQNPQQNNTISTLANTNNAHNNTLMPQNNHALSSTQDTQTSSDDSLFAAQNPTQNTNQTSDTTKNNQIDEFDYLVKEQEKEKTMSDEDIEREINRLCDLDKKEYAISIDAKIIDTMLKKPLEKNEMPLTVFRDINKETQRLVNLNDEQKYTLRITDEYIKENINPSANQNTNQSNNTNTNQSNTTNPTNTTNTTQNPSISAESALESSAQQNQANITQATNADDTNANSIDSSESQPQITQAPQNPQQSQNPLNQTNENINNKEQSAQQPQEMKMLLETMQKMQEQINQLQQSIAQSNQQIKETT